MRAQLQPHCSIGLGSRHSVFEDSLAQLLRRLSHGESIRNCNFLYAMSSAKGLLHVLGISFSETKLKPFDRQGEVLGLVVDTGDFGKGKSHYKMKETRRVDILEELKTIMDEQKVTPAKLPL